MKKELELFSIDGSCCGNQDRMVNPWMKLGGCAALAAVDSCILLTLYNGFSGICPTDLSALNWESYNHFAKIMRPYLSPRMMGVNRLHYYTDGFGAYLRDVGCRSLRMEAFPMGVPADEARNVIMEQIDAGFPVPILHLNPKTRSVKEYRWHWFLLTGYEEKENTFKVKAVTYGEAEWLSLANLWHEEDTENGGLILYRHACPAAPNDFVRNVSAIICDRPDRPAKVLAVCSREEDHCCYFPTVTLGPEDDAEDSLKRELAEKWNLPVSVIGLLAVNEYDKPPVHFSDKCFKAVLTDASRAAISENGDMIWLSEETLGTVRWRPCDAPLINIIHSDMTDIDAIQKRIAREEAAED